MKIERLNIADLRPAEKNTRIHNRKQIEELVRSFRMFGQIRPVIIDENNVIWCGNGFYEAAKQAGESQIDAYRIVGLDENQKRKLMLADNQTFLLGATNTSIMDEFLTEMQDFDVPGFDADTLQQLYGAIEEATEELQSYGVLDQESVQAIERAEARMSDERDERVFVRDEAPTPVPAAPAASGGVVSDEGLLPRTIESAEGMVNIPKDKNSRPFIVCPKCGEQIWV